VPLSEQVLLLYLATEDLLREIEIDRVREFERAFREAARDTLADLLARIEKVTGNRVRIVDKFGREDSQVLAKRISLDLRKKTFWEAVDAVCAAASVRFNSIDDGVLRLSTEGSQFDKIEPIGKPAVVGAFRVFAGYDDFFENAVIVIRSEPRVGPPQLKGYQAQVTLPDGKQIDYEPKFLQATPNVLTGDLKLKIDPNPSLPEVAHKAQQIKLEARLAVASGFKEYTSPPLGTLTPKTVKVGQGTVLVNHANVASQPYNRPALAVKLVARGLSDKLNDVVLVAEAGNQVKSFAGGAGGVSGSSDKKQTASMYYRASEISGNPGRCRLVFQVPGEGEKTIGPLADLTPKPISAGAMTLRITEAKGGEQSGQDFEVIIDSDSFVPSSKQVALVGTGGQPVEPRGENPFGSSIRLWFDPAKLPGRPESYRLRVQAPTKVTEHVLEATFNDVPLTEEE
jgi:hypothetical protein